MGNNMPPAYVILNDNMVKIDRTLAALTKWLELSYLQTQQKEAEKVPRVVNAYAANISVTSVFQLLPRNIERHSVTVYNNGPGDIIYDGQSFNHTSILQQFSDPNAPSAVTPLANQVIKIGYAPTGSSFTFDSTSPLWVYNLNGAALLSILESVYQRSGMMGTVPPGYDGVVGQGYETAEIDGAKIPVKGLR